VKVVPHCVGEVVGVLAVKGVKLEDGELLLELVTGTRHEQALETPKDEEEHGLANAEMLEEARAAVVYFTQKNEA